MNSLDPFGLVGASAIAGGFSMLLRSRVKNPFAFVALSSLGTFGAVFAVAAIQNRVALSNRADQSVSVIGRP